MSGAAGEGHGDPSVALARERYATRRRRDAALPGLFGEPAWDILLDLYVAAAEARQVSVSSACIAGAAPAATALRYIGALIERGLVTSSPDPRDGRRTWVRLSDAGQALMEQLLTA